MTLLSAFARTRTTHAQRQAATAGLLAGVPAGGLVRFSSHGTKHPVCKPLEGRTFAPDDAPRPPMHPSCGHKLIRV